MQKKSFIVWFSILSLVVGCKKEDKNTPTTPSYSIPTTYNFNFMDSSAIVRLSMLDEIITYAKTGNTQGTVLDGQKLKNMFTNTSQPFTDSFLNTIGFRLSEKILPTEVSSMETFMDSIALASTSTQAGSNGIPGVIPGSKSRLCGGSGMEYVEMIEKEAMGAIFYYQITTGCLGTDKMSTSQPKEDRLRAWDEAFGYFGVPIDFPTNTTNLRYVGKYANTKNTLLSCNAKIMNAFIKGRAALVYDDSAVVQEQINIIKTELERVFAAVAIGYLNKAKSGILDDNARNHAISEGLGFIKGLSHNPSKKITDIQITEALSRFKTNGQYNFYNVTVTQIEEVKTILSTVYGFDSIKDVL